MKYEKGKNKGSAENARKSEEKSEEYACVKMKKMRKRERLKNKTR